MPKDTPGYLMQPRTRPGPRDFIENQFVLHPSMGFRLDAFRRAGLRYGPDRLEDKALLLQACKAGLRIRNMAAVAGSYSVHPGARDLFRQKWLNLRLNLEFLKYHKVLRYVPHAILLFVLHVALASDRLRRIRHRMRQREAARGSFEQARQGGHLMTIGQKSGAGSASRVAFSPGLRRPGRIVQTSATGEP